MPSELSYVPVYGCYLDVQQRDATFNVPTTPTTFVWTTEVTDTANIYNPATGVVVLPFSGMFNFNFTFNTSTIILNARQLMAAAELWNGSSWVKSEFSARQQAVRSGDHSQATYVSTNFFAAGTMLRFPLWCDASVTLVTEVPPAGTGFTIPAARFLLTGIRTV